MHCLGFEDGVRLRVWFGSKGRKQAHKARYCNDIHGYEKCPLYLADIDGA